MVRKHLVKVCGTRTAEAAETAILSGADLIGIICVPGRSRTVSPEDARESISGLYNAQRALLVGVFQNQPLDEVQRISSLYNVDVIQLHGSEPLDWAGEFDGKPVIKSFSADECNVSSTKQHIIPLIDSGAGGTGERVSLAAVKTLLTRNPDLNILLAGGLRADNVREVVEGVGPELKGQIIGVDASSGLETGGKQDLNKIRKFVETVKAI
ncbi:N-anthranilate isomerase [Piedraia hortae CBS 480.64]|uniref:N-(5'-phosphoribosyl)anthranilate isomerase n=1 Tax=Piedraia hortae CBS 480.64 TaxID=1314780 RepID=A0A6A7C8V1_9PEZI|nr:N-anthranilate isomerase [Piedraia hortae CBS 480.64]